jgi:hypothetical protein
MKAFERTTKKPMEILVNGNSITTQQQGITLRKLVSRLVADTVPVSVRNGSFIINDIPASLILSANTEMIAVVLNNLLNTVAANATGSCIRISAKIYSNVILVQLRDKNSINTYTIANNLQAAQPIAESIGGYLAITSQRKNETTIVFSFPNLPAAA